MDLHQSIVDLDKSDDYSKKSNFYFCHSTRYFIMVAAIFCLTCIMSNSVALNFTIICMTNGEDHNTSDINSAIRKLDDHAGTPIWGQTLLFNLFFLADEKYHYSSIEKGWLFSSVSIGALVGTGTMILIFPILGTRITFTLYGLISAIAILLTPISAQLGFYYLCAMRFLVVSLRTLLG